MQTGGRFKRQSWREGRHQLCFSQSVAHMERTRAQPDEDPLVGSVSASWTCTFAAWPVYFSVLVWNALVACSLAERPADANPACLLCSCTWYSLLQGKLNDLGLGN